MQIYGWRKPLTVIHHLSIFGDRWSCASGDIKYIICHVTSPNHVTEGLSNYDWELFIVYHHPAKFSGHRLCSSGDVMISDCHVKVCYHPTKFGDHMHCGIGDIIVCHMIL